MGIPLYLAMTAAEFRHTAPLPRRTAWLSCLFSPYGTGLSNMPKQLPADSLLILSDRTPIFKHDPEIVKTQLSNAVKKLGCCGVLLDFQRAKCEETQKIARTLTALPCPVAVPEAYAEDIDCPVFLPPIPPHISPEAYLMPWQGREIWLEIALQQSCITVSEKGSSCTVLPVSEKAKRRFLDETLCCHYDITVSESIGFTLERTQEDIQNLLHQAESLGVTKAVGLYQELG